MLLENGLIGGIVLVVMLAFCDGHHEDAVLADCWEIRFGNENGVTALAMGFG